MDINLQYTGNDPSMIDVNCSFIFILQPNRETSGILMYGYDGYLCNVTM